MKFLALLTSSLTVAAGLLAAAMPAQAQDRVYRCGNEYTNRIKGRTDCKPVEGAPISVIYGNTPPSRPTAATGGGNASAPRAAVLERRTDADGKLILENELRRAEAQQAELEKNYNNGAPAKLGDEAKDNQKYLNRVTEMKASIARNQNDIEAIKRELERFK